MQRKNLAVKDIKGVSKQIRKKFIDVVDGLELDLRVQNSNRLQNLQRMQFELKKICIKINEFSNLLLEDDFKINRLEDHPLILTRYCESMFTILINTLSENQKTKNFAQKQKGYNENNVYEVVAALKLENFDLKQKVASLQNQLLLSKQRADCAQQISQNIRSSTDNFMKNYQQNFVTICDLLKKAQTTELQLLQNNRFLKQQLQSLSIQFEKYKEYFKSGPTIKEKQFKMKTQLQRDYQFKLKNTIKQLQTTIRSQLQKSIVEKFQMKNIKNLKF